MKCVHDGTAGREAHAEVDANVSSCKVTLPDARTGLVLVYRVFEKASYALVMNTSRPVYLLDVVKNP